MLEDDDKKHFDVLLDGLPEYAGLVPKYAKVTPEKLPENDTDALVAFEKIRTCCYRFYQVENTGFRYPFQGKFQHNEPWIEVTGSITNKPKLLTNALLPWAKVNNKSADLTLKKIILFSDFSIITLPMHLETHQTTSWNHRGRIMTSELDLRALWLDKHALSECLALNLKYKSLLKNYQLVFLPEVISEKREDLVVYKGQIDIYTAPYKQAADNFFYVPYNTPSQARPSSSESKLDIFINIDLPYLPKLSLDDIVKIKLNETDAFPRFQFFLKKKLRELGSTSTTDDLKQIAEEIEYEVHRLNIEAKKLSKLKIVQGASIGLFTISLAALFMSNIPALQGIAGLLGTTTFHNIIKDYIEGQSRTLDLKKDNFYVPFLFGKMTKK